MNTQRKVAIITGALFLTAIVTSLGGGIWLETMLSAPDSLSTIAGNESQVVMGVLIELINCVAVIGIAMLLYPVFKQLNEALAIGYVGFRLTEAIILVMAVVSPLVLVTLSQEYTTAGAADATYFQSLAAILLSARSYLTGLLVTVFFSLSALVLYYLSYQSRLIPRFISVWGFIAVLLVFAWNLLEAFGISTDVGIIFGLPMILNEVILGIWLIVKGFNTDSLAPQST